MEILLAVTGLLLVSGIYCLHARWHREAFALAVALVGCIYFLLPMIGGTS